MNERNALSWNLQKGKKCVHSTSVWTIENTKYVVYVIESNQDLNFRLVTGLLNQSTLKCSKSYSNFGLCPIYLFDTTRKYIKIPILLINLHDLFSAHTFIWSTRLCGTLEHNFAVWSKMDHTGSRLQKNIVFQKLE